MPLQGYVRRNFRHVVAAVTLCWMCIPAIAATNAIPVVEAKNPLADPDTENLLSGAGIDNSIAGTDAESVVAVVNTKNAIARVDTKDAREGSQIRIVFSEPLLYVGHEPLKSGTRLTIRLRPLANPSTFVKRYQGKQSLRQAPSSLIPLTNVLYVNESGARARVILEFNRDVVYRVKGSKQGDSITVTLPSIVIKGTPPDPLPTAPGDVSLEGHYIVNLESSDKPVPIWTIPHHELFERYRLYTRKVRIDGKEWERLRLGFFPDKSTAQTIVDELQDIYPGAWIAAVPRKEKVLSVRTLVKPTGSQKQTDEPAASNDPEDRLKRWYALDLQSRSAPYTLDALPRFEQFESLHPYVAETQRGTSMSHNLRLGFFSSVEDARDVAKLLRKQYPTPQIVLVTDLERQAAMQPGVLVQRKAGQVEEMLSAPPAQVEEALPATLSKSEKLYELSRRALTAGEYTKAIALLTKLLETESDEYRPEAQELLGFARERNGQFAHAKAEYETYLSLYPDTEGSQRVKQRLAGLLTAAKTPSEPQSGEQGASWDGYGTLSQFYWRDSNRTDDDEDIVSVSELSSYVLLGGRVRSDSFDVRSQFAFVDRRDFLEENDHTRVLDAYVDFADRRYDYFVRGGRQTLRTGGVLGRFDGVFAGYHLNDHWTANVVAGTPVYSFDSGLDVDQQFYGLSADLALNRWDMSAFFIEQTADSLLDRRAIGGEVRYFDPTKTVLGLIDYDIHYERTNIAFLSGTWALGAKNSLYGSIDYRTSPLLTTSNALLGQTAVSLEELRDLYTPSEIEAIAVDRTATTETLSLGATRRFTRTLQGTLDATFAELSDTEASAGVEATPGNRWNYYSVQMIKNDLALPRDVSVLSLRYSDNDMADIYSLLASYRLPLNGWRINPHGRFDVRTNENDDRTRNELTIALRADYQVRRNVRLEMELGVGRSDEQFEDVDQESSRYYARAGYYWDF